MSPRFRAIDPATAKVSAPFEIEMEQGEFVPLAGGHLYGAGSGYSCLFDRKPILSQFTSQADAAGQEIWEWDILVHPEHGDDEYTPFYLVRFNEDQGMWAYYEICDWDSLKTGKPDLVTENAYALYSTAEELYVVGNLGISHEQAWEAAKKACAPHWDLGDLEAMHDGGEHG